MNPPRAADRFWILAAVLTCVGALTYFLNLGVSGFSMSEGHRVAPAWEMLANRDWLLPHMFEQAYLRKPPGMPWAIALFSSVLGQTEFAARAVSASAMIIAAVVSAWFSRRWFGTPAAWAAGLSHLLLPWMWESGRAAEIESLNNLGTSLAVWSLVDLLVNRPRNVWPAILIAAAGAIIAALAKGPASLLVIVSAPLAACAVVRSGSPLKSRGFWSAAALSAICIGALALLIYARVQRESGSIVTQGVQEFLWSAAKAPQIAALPFLFLVFALPTSLALAPALLSNEMPPDQARVARTLALTAVMGVAAYTCAGVSNPRYLLPAAAGLSPLMGFALITWQMQSRGGSGLRARTALMLATLAKPVCAVLLIGSVAYGFISEKKRAASSGREAGMALGAFLEDEALVVADDMIEARPEIFLYTMREAVDRHKNVRIRWAPGVGRTGLAAIPQAERVYILVRTDAGSGELAAIKSSGTLKQLEATPFQLKVGAPNRPFEGTLFRVRAQKK